MKQKKFFHHIAELKALRQNIPKQKTSDVSVHDFITNVRTGESLRPFSAPVFGYKKRECYQKWRMGSSM